VLHDRPTPYKIALLIILNALHYSRSKGKNISRFRAGASFMRLISQMTVLNGALLDEVREELNRLGWAMAILPDGDNFVFFRADSVERWAGLGSKRLLETGYLEMPDEELKDLFDQLSCYENGSAYDDDAG